MLTDASRLACFGLPHFSPRRGGAGRTGAMRRRPDGTPMYGATAEPRCAKMRELRAEAARAAKAEMDAARERYAGGVRCLRQRTACLELSAHVPPVEDGTHFAN